MDYINTHTPITFYFLLNWIQSTHKLLMYHLKYIYMSQYIIHRNFPIYKLSLIKMYSNNNLPLLFPSAQNLVCDTVRTLLLPSCLLSSTVMTGKPICLVHVDITAFTGLALASSSAAHKSSVNVFRYWNLVRYMCMPFLKSWNIK